MWYSLITLPRILGKQGICSGHLPQAWQIASKCYLHDSHIGIRFLYIYNSYWDKVEAPNTIAKLDDESDNYRIFGRYNYGFYGVYTEFTSFFTVNFAPPSSLGLRYSHRPNLLSSFTEAAENWLRRPISTTGKKYSIYWIAGIGKCPILGILDITL